jgi:hypothetical protein
MKIKRVVGKYGYAPPVIMIVFFKYFIFKNILFNIFLKKKLFLIATYQNNK